jgi:hypothetical protein
MSEHSGVTGKIPQSRPFRASFLRQEAPNQNTASGKVRDVINVMRINKKINKATKQIIEKVLVSAPLALIAIGLAAPASAAPNPSVTVTVTPAPPAPAAVAPGGTGVHIASLTGCIASLNCG